MTKITLVFLELVGLFASDLLNYSKSKAEFWPRDTSNLPSGMHIFVCAVVLFYIIKLFPTMSLSVNGIVL